jgi:23S rRNA (uracil1939-C5)-methyltransferase
VRIVELAAGGDGFALLDGAAVFVSRTAPGDLVTLSGVTASRGVLFARPGELVEPSPLRRNPPCPFFPECGGCAWQHLPYPAQLDWKGRHLSGTLRRVGGIEAGESVAVAPSPAEFGWRHRIRLHHRDGRFGFFREGSHRMVEWERCLVAPQGLNRAVGALRSGGVTLPGLSAVEMTLAEDGSVLALMWRLATPAWPRRRELAEQAASALAPGNWKLAQGFASGEEPAPREWEGPRVAIRSGSRGALSLASPGAFTQVNPAQNAVLVDEVISALNNGGARSLLDLFCGNGNFALAAAEAGIEVLGVDSHSGAIADARAAVLPGMRAEFRREPVEDIVRMPLPRPFDAVLVDPPRPGLATAVRRALGRWRVPLLVYVSCNPATLARDLGHLTTLGYRLDSLAAFDLFPQTPHVESLAVLTHHG